MIYSWNAYMYAYALIESDLWLEILNDGQHDI